MGIVAIGAVLVLIAENISKRSIRLKRSRVEAEQKHEAIEAHNIMQIACALFEKAFQTPTVG